MLNDIDRFVKKETLLAIKTILEGLKGENVAKGVRNASNGLKASLELSKEARKRLKFNFLEQQNIEIYSKM